MRSVMTGSLRDNVQAFDRIKLCPRVAIDISRIDTTATCFGAKVCLQRHTHYALRLTSQNTMPLGFAPAAMHKMAHPVGELGTSSAAAAHGVNMILSQYATASIEDVVRAGSFSDNAYGQQLCITEDLETTWNSIRRVEGGFLCQLAQPPLIHSIWREGHRLVHGRSGPLKTTERASE